MTSDDAVPSADIDLVAASLRADSQDLDIYANALLQTLGDAFPAGVVDVERDRTLSDRVSGKPGKVVRLQVNLGETGLELKRDRAGRPQGLVITRVGGVVISRRDVGLAEWSEALAQKLVEAAVQSRAAAAALERLLGL